MKNTTKLITKSITFTKNLIYGAKSSCKSQSMEPRVSNKCSCIITAFSPENLCSDLFTSWRSITWASHQCWALQNQCSFPFCRYRSWYVQPNFSIHAKKQPLIYLHLQLILSNDFSLQTKDLAIYSTFHRLFNEPLITSFRVSESFWRFHQQQSTNLYSRRQLAMGFLFVRYLAICPPEEMSMCQVNHSMVYNKFYIHIALLVWNNSFSPFLILKLPQVLNFNLYL